MTRPTAFIYRGIITMFSYRIALVLQILSMFITTASFYFLAKLVGFQANNPYLAQYGGDYMVFLIIGIIFQSFVMVSQSSFSQTIRNEQYMGTLESLLLSNTPLHKILTYSSLWTFLFTAINTGVILAIAIVVFKVNLNANLLASSIILALSIVSLAGIGMISAGVIMVTKQGDPVSWFVSIISAFLSGVYYPIEVLPKFLKSLALLLPNTHALIALRQTLINNYSIWQVKDQLFLLLIFSLVTIPLGIIAFRKGFDRARKEGTLSYY
ncbi:MAG: ABC transporter permease [Candidatus Zixiibacteriota bacterium]|nr:MAG: ABC transporter permease [candidate division Zixibacteria bacterium]